MKPVLPDLEHIDDLCLVTCSYGPDLARAQRLCASVDQWVAPSIPHKLVVPARDRHQFASLETARRQVLAVEEVVPGGFRQLPFTNRWWMDRSGWPVRGWIMQQVTKLSASYVTHKNVIMFVDSDLQFFRPLQRDHVVDGRKVRLHQVPNAKSEGEHLRWHHRAASLLGLPKQYFGADYIGQLITWRRDHLIALQERLGRPLRKPWYTRVARSLYFSEYILYGVFVEHVLGSQSNSHYASSSDICHCCWFQEEADALDAGHTLLDPSAVAVLIQSNLGLSSAEENAVLESAIQRFNMQFAGAQS